MKKTILLTLFAACVASGCSDVVTKNFKVFAYPPDSEISVFSGVDLQELKFRSPATITAGAPKDPVLAAKAVVVVFRENYQPRTIPLSDVQNGDTLNIRLEKTLRDIVKYKQTYRLISPVVSQELQFRDRNISVSFAVGEQAFQMRFENGTAFDIKILWERAAYTDVNGVTHRLMHSGVRYQDRNNPIPDQFVLSKNSVQQTVFPVSSVYLSRQKKAYELHPLFRESDGAAGLRGKTVVLFIPVEINRQIIPYNFKIEITESVRETVKG